MNTFNLDSFFPKEKLQLIKAEQTNDIIHIYLKSKTKSCVCPKCGQSTEEYHGTYVRHVQDLPILGKNVQLHIKVHEYKCTNGVELTEENKKQFYISEGFAHGFLVLSDTAEFCYKCTDFYHPGDEGGLAWNDPEIGIEWPELVGEYNGTASAEGYALKDGTKLNLSDKDQKWVGVKNTFKF